MDQISSSPSVLFVHGYAQNSQIFQQRLKNLTKKLNKKFSKMNYIFPDAPFIVEKKQIDPSVEDNEIYRGWMTIDNQPEDFQTLKSAYYNGMTQSIDELFSIGSINQDIQCIFAFSQGSEILLFMVLLSLYNDKYNFLKYFPNIKCLIFVSGFVSPVPENKEFKDIIDKILSEGHRKCDIPSLHVYGLTDEIISHQKSKEIIKYFSVNEIFEHPGKHFIPSAKNDIILFENYLEKYLKFK